MIFLIHIGKEALPISWWKGNWIIHWKVDKTKGMVTVEVSDAVDLAALRIKKLTVTNEAEVRIDSAACLDITLFHESDFRL